MLKAASSYSHKLDTLGIFPPELGLEEEFLVGVGVRGGQWQQANVGRF